MKCFIAMAFSHSDTDSIYETGIKPALLARGIQPVRVDKIEHNNNIDDKIISEIQTADFAIADLTYARPSVYYEAGFAERIIPVIYTVRRDHFSPALNDEFGVFKVHFDLFMKNIIDWLPGDDDVFLARLGARIDKVTEPMLVDFNKKKLQEEKSRSFLSLPVTKREEVIRYTAREFFNTINFMTEDRVKKYGNMSYRRSYDMNESVFFNTAVETYRFLRMEVHTKLDKLPSATYLIEDYGKPAYNLNTCHNLNTITSIEDHKLIFSFNAISFETLCLENPSFNSNEQNHLLYKQSSVNIPIVPDGFTGDVFLGHQDIAENSFVKFWKGGDTYQGFYTKTPASGMQHTREDTFKEFEFVYGISFRTVQRIQKVHLLDKILSEEDLIERLKAIFII